MNPANNLLARSVVTRISFKEINDGTVIKDEPSQPSFLLTKDDERLYRIFNYGVIVDKELQGTVASLLVDDGTAILNVKLFEEKKELENLSIGAAILLVAKVRLFNQVKYLAPEIIKVVDPLWLKVQCASRKEKKQTQPVFQPESSQDKPEIKIVEKTAQKDSSQKMELAADPDKSKFPVEKLIDLINKLDSGSGATIEEIIEKSPLAETEKLIERMLESGDIFQSLPGKVKVL